MTQQEFTIRTNYTPKSADEFWAIHDEYMNSSMGKDEFCKAWKRRNARFIMPGVEHKFKSERETEAFVLECIQKDRVFAAIGRTTVMVWPV